MRDRAIFVGNPDDVVRRRASAPDLPAIRDWTERHFDFAGLRHRLRPGATPTASGCARSSATRRTSRSASSPSAAPASARALLRRVDRRRSRRARERVPGPAHGRRRRPADRPGVAARRATALEVRAYVPDLYRHLAACDLAVVQGGLTTAMELTANRRPFLYVPLRHHFEQNFHVRHRLERYGAGRRMDYDDATARRRSPTRSPRRSAARSTTAPSRPTAPARAAARDRRAALNRQPT